MKYERIIGLWLLSVLVVSSVMASGSNVRDASPTIANINEIKSSDPDYTGSLPLDFPLLSIPTRGTSVPVVLTYSQGIRVDQEASFVGLGFNLGMGAVTRAVVNKPDDSPTGLMNGNEEDDYQQDSYFFSVGSQAGRIILVRQAGTYVPVMQSWQPWEIRYYDSEGNIFSGSGGIARWEIASDDGTTYVFDQPSMTQQVINNRYTYTKRNYNGQCPYSIRCGDPTICEPQDSCGCYECAGLPSCAVRTECNNGIDDDGDGCFDMNDNDCTSTRDTSESGSNCPRIPDDKPILEYDSVTPITPYDVDMLYSGDLPSLAIGGVYLVNGHPWPLQTAYCNTSGTPPQQIIYANTAATTVQDEIDTYPNSWLLTQIRYPDYIDTNDNAVPDDEDYGDWAKISYTITGTESFSSTKRISTHDENPALGVDMTPKCRKALLDHPFPQDVAYWSDTANIWNLDCEFNGGVPKTNRYNFIRYSWVDTTTDMIYLNSVETPTHIAEFELEPRDDLINKDGQISTMARRLKDAKLRTKIDGSVMKQADLMYGYVLADAYDRPPKLTLLGFSQSANDGTTMPDTTFEYAENPELHEYAFDWYGFNNGILTNTNGINDHHSSNAQASAWSLSAINYPYGSRAQIEYEPASFDFVQDEPVAHTLGGGIMVHSITRYDGLDAGSTVEYTYENCAATLKPRLTKGIISAFTNIAPGLRNYVACGVVTINLPGGKGKVVQEYSSPLDYPDTAIDSTGNPHVSMDEKRGNLLSTKLYDAQGNLVEESQNQYDTERVEHRDAFDSSDGLRECTGEPLPCGLRSFST
ncbi:MAG: hypothetical protein ABIH41_00500, partial [Nanoarchaeota archaeon]